MNLIQEEPLFIYTVSRGKRVKNTISCFRKSPGAPVSVALS